jgi:hypothetical protein
MYFTGKLSPLVFGAQVMWSLPDAPPGDFAADLVGFVQGVVDSLVIPMVDSVLANGIPLPTGFGGIRLQNLFFAYGNHVVSFGFDMELSESADDAADRLLDWIQN